MMPRRLVIVVLVTSLVSCMEMRETVERMVMVRTSGSDLQPAATGFIYKKESDGPASVVKLKETEVMEQLSKLYEKPESFVAPIPVAAGPFHAKEDEDKAASHAKEHVIPVVEKADSQDDVDGIADEVVYPKEFKEYSDNFGDYKSDFADYLHGLGHFDHDVFHGYDGGSDYGSKGFSDYNDNGFKGYGSKHHHEKGGAGDYQTEKYASYSISGKGGHKRYYDDADSHGEQFEHGGKKQGDDNAHKQAHSKDEALDGYHKVFNKNEYKKDHEDYDGEKVEGDFSKHEDGHDEHQSGSGEFGKGIAHESGSSESDFGKGGFNEHKTGDANGAKYSSEESGDSTHHGEESFAAKSGKFGSYGFGIKH